MGHPERIDWLPRYRAVLVATAVLAVREAPPALQPDFPSAGNRSWAGETQGARDWRAVAVAAGAIREA
jgi:hypothetical protein